MAMSNPASRLVHGARGRRASWQQAAAAVLAIGMWQLQHAGAVTMRELHMNAPDEAPLQPNETLNTDLLLVPIRRPDGTIGLAEVPEESKRPLKIAFYEVAEPSVAPSPETRSFVVETVMPGIASLLSRSVRVRFPSGPLQFAGREDTSGQPIPPGPGPNGTYDADLVVKVTTSTPEGPDCEGTLAFALGVLFETLTRRPTFGEITLCRIFPTNDFAATQAVVLHEMMHVLGFSRFLYETYFGYQGALFDVVAVSPGIPDDDYDYFAGDSGRYAYAYEALYAAVTPGAAPSNYDLGFALDFFGYGGQADAYAPAFAPGAAPLAAEDLPGRLSLFDPYAYGYYDYSGTSGGAPGPEGARGSAGAPPFAPAGAPALAPLTDVLDLLYGDGYGPRRRFDFGTPVDAGIIAPNALREARQHFGCPSMESVLLQQDPESFTSHWSARLFRGELMQPRSVVDEVTHFDRPVLSDVTLGLLQDTGWYDVKYGSGGFNSFGYQAGCTFVNLNNTIETILQDPAARQYLCTREQVGTQQCFHDFSGVGVCLAELLLGYDDFYVSEQLYDYQEDCQGAPGARCISGAASGNSTAEDAEPVCAQGFSCSADGQVLVDGAVCSLLFDGCPPDELMCGDPGLLTCATPQLNDCNAHGDCLQGRCFCHVGFGGADCSLRVCTTSCADGSPCPPSGFCGVPECGEWSVGDEGKGTPCTTN